MAALRGKTALVTGASSGIGQAIAARLAADGAVVAVHYGSNAAGADRTVAQITDAGGTAYPVRAEFSRPDAADRLWAAFDSAQAERNAEPRLDILVNNAAIPSSGGLDEVDHADFDRLYAVNVRAPYFVIQRGLGRLRDHGRIVNISSGVTRIALPATLAYSMTKGAINVLSSTLAHQLGSRGITVNAVAPGIVEVDGNTAWLRRDPDEFARWSSYSAFNRVGRPADIADVVAFIASDDARWITGQYIDATGGSLLGA